MKPEVPGPTSVVMCPRFCGLSLLKGLFLPGLSGEYGASKAGPSRWTCSYDEEKQSERGLWILQTLASLLPVTWGPGDTQRRAAECYVHGPGVRDITGFYPDLPCAGCVTVDRLPGLSEPLISKPEWGAATAPAPQSHVGEDSGRRCPQSAGRSARHAA